MKQFSLKRFAAHHRRPLPSLGEVRACLEKLHLLHEQDHGGPLSNRASELLRVSRRLANRLDWGLDAPLVAAVLGATGTGKSKVFNSLIGINLSPSGFKRPTTLAPVVHSDPQSLDRMRDAGFLPGYDKTLSASPGPVRFNPDRPRTLFLAPGEDPEWPRLGLIDTPDFDSVLADNRSAAKDVFDRCDAVIFVTDAIKYADQMAWDYLERIRLRDKNAVLVVNRVKNPLSVEDFTRRLHDALLIRPVLSIPAWPELADDDPLPADDPALVELRRYVARWADQDRNDLLLHEANRDGGELLTGLLDDLIPALERAATELDSLRRGLDHTAKGLQEDLGPKMAVSISGELKNNLIAQIQALFLRWDLLRYPRRLMAMPFTVIRERILLPLGVGKGGSGGGAVLKHEIDRLFESNCEALVSMVHEFNRQAGDLFSAGPLGRGLASRPEFDGLPMSGDEIRVRYAEIRAELEQWVHEQASELAKSLNLSEKMTFYLAQALSLGLFVSIQVHTGGGFSFFDGLLDSVLAPVMSKIAGTALSRDKVRTFEEQAVRMHLDRTRRLVDDQARRYLDFLARAEDGLTAAAPLSRAAFELQTAFEFLS